MIRAKIYIAAALLLGLLLAGCARVSTQIEAIAQALEARGRTVSVYEAGSEMLAALDDEMDEYLDDPTEQPLRAYLFARKDDPSLLDCEVFIFETAQDAQRLYNYLRDSDAFIPGESEIRCSGAVVYMGYIEALEIVESAKR